MALVCLGAVLTAAPGAAQGRTAGQIVGTVRDASGAVIPKADLILIDNGTGATVEAKSGSDGNFVFPNLQPGRYQITATMQGFNPVTIQEVVVETARSVDVVVQFQVAGVSEAVRVEGRSQVVETTSTTVANTVSNAQISRLPLAGRNILSFALLVPGANTSAGSRDSEYNGLPGGAINITLDGINNNSARFRSGGTSFFTFAPIRLGAIEEVTVSTAGLTADAGAEGAVQIQFVTKRGTNAFRGQFFDQIQSDKLNAQGVVNKSRNIPKTKLRQHEFGANFGGPILRNKLFFFGNYEQVYSPSEATLTRTVLTPEAQTGVFRYSAADNSIRTVNVLDIARASGLESTIDPFVAAQLNLINGTLGRGSLTTSPTNLFSNTFSFINKNEPNSNIYPTGRVDYQATKDLAIRGVLNLHWRDLARNRTYPDQPQWAGGFTSTYYILSTGADWTLKPNLFYQASFGAQSNFEEFNPGNTLAMYEPQGGRRIILPLISQPEPSDDLMPIPRNNPVWNVTNTLTWLKGKHTYTFGGTFRRTTMYESIGGGPPTVTVGMAGADPATSVFSAATIPGLRQNDEANVRSLYALLTGRVSTAGGTFYINDAKEYGLNPAFRREAQNVGGVYAQDQWRVSPKLTLNYGLRWEFSGAAMNANDVYSGPEISGILGPSTGLFQPGTVNGDPNPQISLRPKPYKADLNNPAPNVGVAWNPDKPAGVLGALLGEPVFRANYGVNYYDEGLINFQTFAGNGPGLSQTLSLPAFTPGSLSLRSGLPPYIGTPASFSFPIAMSGFTFGNRGFATIDPDIKTPYVQNWTVGYQRELWNDAAIEIRYVGNRGGNLWRGYNFNETNIVENGFLNEFRNAQRNLQINVANGRSGFANQGLPGQVPLPIFETAFGPRGGVGAVPSNSGFTNGTFITNIQQGQAGRMANALAGNFLYLCPMVGNQLSGCTTGGRNYNAPGPYPINFFQANPLAAGQNVRILTDEAKSEYDSLQIQFRQRLRRGVSLTANYTYGKARTDRYGVTADNTADYVTLRDKSLNWGPTAYDLRHNFQAYGTVDIPVGSGRHFDVENALLDQLVGGWAVSAVVRIQTGRPFLLTSGRQTVNQQDAGVVLNGITVEELQKKINVRPGPNGNVFYFDEDVIGADGRANSSLIGYPTAAGQFGQFVYLYGPGFWTADLGLSKQFSTPGGSRFNFEALFINAFNHRNSVVGGTGGTSVSIDSTTFGQTTGTAIGARQIQFRLGFYF